MAAKHQYGLILAGGRGTRFWPRSRRRTPKQLLPFFGERSLVQETVERLRPLIPPERLWILTNKDLQRAMRRQLPEIPPRQILAEPEPRNTAPAIGLAARIVAEQDPDAVLGVFPSDHHIARPGLYRRLVKAAFKGAERGFLMVMGIEPRWPETGYGYIEFPDGTRPGGFDAVPVLRFREKPDLETARRFLAAGRFYWNSGQFFWRAGVILDALRRYLPRTAELLDSLPPFGSRAFSRALRETFPKAENISIDYAVLEKADNVAGVVAGDIGWNDLGSWNAVYELLARRPGDNVARGELLALDSRGNFVEAGGKLVALVGVDDLVVVDTGDALLVAARAQAQKVGQIVKLLEKQKRNELL